MEVLVRRARESDKGPLMGFIKDVWGGHDYIPQVWDEWLRDDSAPMFVLEADGKPVAMNRVRFLRDGSAWFEGVRVHPDYRRLGLATKLGKNALKVASERGIRTFRLTSGSTNKPSHAQVARMGFREVARFSVYDPKKGSRFRPQRGVRVAEDSDTDRVSHLIMNSKEYELGVGMMWNSFAALSLTPQVVSSLVEGGSVYLTDNGVAVATPGRGGKNVWNQVSFVSGPPEEGLRLVRHVFAANVGAGWNLAYVPHGSALIGALRRHGFKRSFSMVLFEKKAPKG